MARNSIRRQKKKMKEAPKSTWVNRYDQPLTGSDKKPKAKVRRGQGGRPLGSTTQRGGTTPKNSDQLTIKKKKRKVSSRGRVVG